MFAVAIQRDATEADFMAATVWSMMLRVVASVPHNDQTAAANAFASRFSSRGTDAVRTERFHPQLQLKIAVTNALAGW